MNITWDGLVHLQNFFRLDFLFSGLEVSSTAVFLARVVVLALFAAGVIMATTKIILKLLDCVHIFIKSFIRLPGAFFLLLLFVIPLSPDSLGARWIGYLVFVICLLGICATSILIAVLWKYGVDQTLRLVNSLRSRASSRQPDPRESSLPADNVMRPMTDPALATPKGSAPFWSDRG